MKQLPEILKRTLIASSRFFNIEAVQLKFSNGELREFERMQGYNQGAVLIVPFYDKDTLLLIREYGAGTHSYSLGFPKGLIDKGELPEVAANRELKEEVGFGAKRLQKLKTVTMAPSYFSSEMHLFMAFDLYPEQLEGDEPEPLEVIKWPLAKIDELLARDDFQEARCISALLLAMKANKAVG
ncbi:ADP compounds hydrolase NudE [Psychromonas sp. Urea-02u-13]|uniref:ADP compounds hydrolase NudE n=1 Tax=Psychromonas sp. Urea-02u-13 TaxID=2058326 RepID=UPI000C32A3F1|nr:ADP compounds hydrolase NudE [Psychromonas sp. Urea-02u-13]PKG40736.1 ADP compounds hydrolase NudE [Psychromonas sp. Urea-02u-13]